MSNLPVQASEPDPASISLPNDAAIEKEVGDSSAPTVKDTAMADAGDKPANVKAGIKHEVEVKSEDNGTAPEVRKEETGSEDEKKDRVNTYENGMLKSTPWEGNGRSGSKYNPEVLPVTNDPGLIRAQVEFYFSDSNLKDDKFLYEATEGASNRPVSISKICSFGRMRRFQPKSAVVSALRESTFLVVSGEEGNESVSRKVPYDPDVPASKSVLRSIYVKGFGDEEAGSQFDIEAFFAPYGPTRSVRLRRTDDKLFKGSVFVEFQDEETAKKFLEMDPKPEWKGHPLDIKSKKEYMDGKEQDIKEGRIQPREQREFGRGRGRGRGGGGGVRGAKRENGNRDRDPNDWKKRREDDRASGFKDNRKDNRGRGRGRNRDGGNRGGKRDNERNRERHGGDKDVNVEDGEGSTKRSGEVAGSEEASAVKKADIKSDAPSEEGSNGQKRIREEDGGAEEKPAKKIDTKAEA